MDLPEYKKALQSAGNGGRGKDEFYKNTEMPPDNQGASPYRLIFK